jgi:flagellar basal-body rod protein FlgF
MDRMIYLSMSGAKATMQRQDTLANNLANVSTVGFRAELQAFRAVPVQGSGASTRVYALEARPATTRRRAGHRDRAQPRRRDEGQQLARGAGLDGTEAYTRAGSLDVSADGTLITRSGLTVLGDGGPIQVPPNSEVSIAPTARSARKRANGKSTAVGKLKLVTPEGRCNAAPTACSGAEASCRRPNARVQDGALEGSNVSAVETMVSMIAAARQFEAQMKMLQTAEGDEKAASQLLSMS